MNLKAFRLGGMKTVNIKAIKIGRARNGIRQSGDGTGGAFPHDAIAFFVSELTDGHLTSLTFAILALAVPTFAALFVDDLLHLEG